MSITRIPSWSITFVDGTGNSSTMRGYLPGGTSETTALAKVNTLAGAVQPITGCVVVRTAVTYTVLALPMDAPLSGSDASRAGLFDFQTAETDVFDVVEVPGILDSTTITSGPFAGITIDTSLTAVAAFIAELTDNDYCDQWAVDLVSIAAAYIRQES